MLQFFFDELKGITGGLVNWNSFRVLQQGASIEEFKERADGFRTESFKVSERLYFPHLSYNLRP